MPRKIRQLKADLRKAGFFERPGRGSHTVWGHPLIPDTVTVAGHDGDEAKRYIEREVRSVIIKARDAEKA